CGQVQPNELVWTQGMPNWAPAGTVQGLLTIPGAGQTSGRFARGPRRSRTWLWVGIGGGVAACAAAVVVVVLLRGKSKGPSSDGGKGGDNSDRELSTKEIVAKTAKSVGHIKGPLGSGTGFIVRPNVIVTNAHVVETATVGQLKVTFPSAGEAGKKEYVPDQMLFFDRNR